MYLPCRGSHLKSFFRSRPKKVFRISIQGMHLSCVVSPSALGASRPRCAPSEAGNELGINENHDGQNYFDLPYEKEAYELQEVLLKEYEEYKK